MSTKHLVDPELAAILAYIPSSPLTIEALSTIRAMSAAPHVIASRTDDLSISEHYVLGPEGSPEVRLLVYLPAAVQAPVPALLWLHGGGYVMGSADAEDAMAKALVSELGCAVAVVDYRLAPETPYPGPVEDCYAALKWLAAQAGEMGIDPARIAGGGSSAGGGLSAALTLLARDRGEVSIAFQCLLAPMLDDRTCTKAESNPYTGEFIWTPQANRVGWMALLGQEPGGSAVSPYAAPARAENLAGLPPTFLYVGAIDLFVDEDIDYAHRLIRAGVPTELHVYPGAYHGFRMVANAQVTQSALRDQVNALKRAFGRSEA
ncbi:MAG: alpha/beta hydrolase [Anaerolineae bacterium]